MSKFLMNQKIVHFAKGTKNDSKYSKPNSLNEIEDNTYTTDMDNKDASIHTNVSDLELSLNDSDLWLDNTHAEIIQIHINNRQMADFRTKINCRKISNQ